MIRLRQIKIKIDDDKEFVLKTKIASKLNIDVTDIIKLKINKKSIDARKKEDIYYVYEVDVKIENEKKVLQKKKSKDIFKTPDENYTFNVIGTKKMQYRPVIVGSGPAGLFCAYFLAENGYKPIIIERGEPIEQRINTVEKFFTTGKLNINSNIQFGEGGAGTFSDGKLNTLVKDKFFRQKKIFEIFVENGAPAEIMYINKPHIGTDLLRNVIINIRKKIIKMGGEFKYNSCLTDLIIENNQLKAIEINHKNVISCDVLALAIGNSARDTFELLYKKGLTLTAKSFAVGVRIQHPQKMIDKAQYGDNKLLTKASYKLVYQTKNKRGVYSFCMCPGGYVINASSSKKGVVTNGMSNHSRSSLNANSAIVVTVSPQDFGSNPLDGVNFQKKLESLAYEQGMGNIPIQLYKDYKENIVTKQLGLVKPILKGNYTLANLNAIFPDYINVSIKEAIEEFGKKIEGFNREDAILAGVESRTSCPICIKRDTFCMSNIIGLFPCGEGSGYAGGITTSAIDGVKTAENIAKIYLPK